MAGLVHNRKRLIVQTNKANHAANAMSRTLSRFG